MKIFEFIGKVSVAVLATFMIATFAEAITLKIPEATGYVVDTVGLLKPNEVEQLTNVCKAVEPELQMAVLVVGSTQPYTIEQYGIKVAEKWKVGFKGKDNGVILILAKNDRKVRIEVGRGTETYVTDASAGKIIQERIIPFFKQGMWSSGIMAGLTAIRERVIYGRQ